jgi:hypothetical protein
MKQIKRYQQVYYRIYEVLKTLNHKPSVRLVTIPYK